MGIADKAVRAAAVTVLTAAVGASAAVAKPLVPAYSGGAKAGKNPVTKPGSIVYSGDGSGLFAGAGKSGRRPKIGRLDWTSYGAKTAEATGANWVNNCVPNCASGTFYAYPVTLKFSKPKREGGHQVFSRMKVTFTGSKPKFDHHTTQMWKIRFQHGIYLFIFPPS